VVDTNEMNKWLVRLQRKLDTLPMTKVDREELEDTVGIIVRLIQMHLVTRQGAGNGDSK